MSPKLTFEQWWEEWKYLSDNASIPAWHIKKEEALAREAWQARDPEVAQLEARVKELEFAISFTADWISNHVDVDADSRLIVSMLRKAALKANGGSL